MIRHCLLCLRPLPDLPWWKRGKWNPMEPPPLCDPLTETCHNLFRVRVGIRPPDIYLRFGEPVLGAWDRQTADVQEAWRDLAKRTG